MNHTDRVIIHIQHIIHVQQHHINAILRIECHELFFFDFVDNCQHYLPMSIFYRQYQITLDPPDMIFRHADIVSVEPSYTSTHGFMYKFRFRIWKCVKIKHKQKWARYIKSIGQMKILLFGSKYIIDLCMTHLVIDTLRQL